MKIVVLGLVEVGTALGNGSSVQSAVKHKDSDGIWKTFSQGLLKLK